MPKPHPKPVERPPHGVTLPRGWHVIHNVGFPYRATDDDTWDKRQPRNRRLRSDPDVDDLIRHGARRPQGAAGVEAPLRLRLCDVLRRCRLTNWLAGRRQRGQ